MSKLRKVIVSTVIALTFTGHACRVSAEDATGLAWPADIVKFEDLHPLTTFHLRVPALRVKGRVIGPAILRVHITTEGTVARAVLLETSGNPDLDEASLHAMRAMRFKPYTFGGVPTEVTLVAPVHVPVQLGRTP